MNEETKETQRRSRGLQRRSESEETQRQLESEIEAIRRGHLTGGYCETEKLHAAEKQLWNFLSQEADSTEVNAPGGSEKLRIIRRQQAGLSYRPRLVVAAEDKP